MFRKSVASVMSNPFRGDRPIWLTLIAAVPCMAGVFLYELITATAKPVFVIDLLFAVGSAGLLLATTLIAVAAAGTWAAKKITRIRISMVPDNFDDTTPEPEYGVAA